MAAKKHPSPTDTVEERLPSPEEAVPGTPPSLPPLQHPLLSCAFRSTLGGTLGCHGGGPSVLGLWAWVPKHPSPLWSPQEPPLCR
jgi:hypothetical protein